MDRQSAPEVTREHFNRMLLVFVARLDCHPVSSDEFKAIVREALPLNTALHDSVLEGICIRTITILMEKLSLLEGLFTPTQCIDSPRFIDEMHALAYEILLTREIRRRYLDAWRADIDSRGQTPE